MTEIWKDIVGYEGIYRISNKGRVRSVSRHTIMGNGSGTHLLRGRILKTNIDKRGYEIAHLSVDGIGVNKKVHRLVCEAFLTQDPDRNLVNHIDGNKTNNNLENLEWVSAQENVIHAIETKLWMNIGENARDNKLTEQEVLDIRNNHNDSYDKLAEMYNISKSTVADIKKFRSWKWLGGDRLIDTKNINKEAIPSEIKGIRKSSGLTIEKFAETLGVSRSTVMRWEKGTIFPKDGAIRLMVEKYNLSI